MMHIPKFQESSAPPLVGRYKLQAVTQVEKTLGWSKKETPIMHWSVSLISVLFLPVLLFLAVAAHLMLSQDYATW